MNATLPIHRKVKMPNSFFSDLDFMFGGGLPGGPLIGSTSGHGCSTFPIILIFVLIVIAGGSLCALSIDASYLWLVFAIGIGVFGACLGLMSNSIPAMFWGFGIGFVIGAILGVLLQGQLPPEYIGLIW